MFHIKRIYLGILSIFACLVLLLSGVNLPAYAQDTVILIDPALYYGGSSGSPMTPTNQRTDNPAGTCAWRWNGTTVGGATAKAQIAITPTLLGFAPNALRIEHIESISYHTYKATAATTSADFYINLYYSLSGHGSSGIGRIDFENLYAYNLNGPGGQWNRWSTDVGTNQLTFHDYVTAGTHIGFYGGPTLPQLTSGPITWTNPPSGSTQTYDYRAGVVQVFLFDTASSSTGLWATFYNDALGGADSGYIDLIEFRFSAAAGGPTHVIVDLECNYPPTPTPTNTSTPISTIVPTVTPPPSASSTPVVVVPEVAPCSLVGGSTSSIVRAEVAAPGVHCRIINENGAYVQHSAEVGDINLINLGVRQAVDIFRFDANGVQLTSLSAPTWVCLQGLGNFYFRDANGQPRTTTLLPSTVQNGFTCATIPNAGTVVLAG